MKIFRRRWGQSTLEYVIILAAVIAAIVAVANVLGGSGGKIDQAYGTLGDTMKTKVEGVSIR